MSEFFTRTESLLGEEATRKLAAASVALFGVGGVGGAAAEALARSGVGAIDLIDPDRVDASNINRQLAATSENIGRGKAAEMSKRLKAINPDCRVGVYEIFYLPENADLIDLSRYDYVLDAIDTVTAKLEIITRCTRLGVPVISCMGTGNRTDPTRLCVRDVYKTEGCPLARVMRRELRRRGVAALKTVCSDEPPLTPYFGSKASADSAKIPPGSTPFVPPAAGFIMAREAVFDLIAK